MHSRFNWTILAGLVTDLLYLFGLAALLLVSKPEISGIGLPRYWLIVGVLGIGLVPLLYYRDRMRRADGSSDVSPSRVGAMRAIPGMVRQ